MDKEKLEKLTIEDLMYIYAVQPIPLSAIERQLIALVIEEKKRKQSIK